MFFGPQNDVGCFFVFAWIALADIVAMQAAFMLVL